MINSVGEINSAAKNPMNLIIEAEANYLSEVYTVARRIADNDDIKIVALAGPSASGKTTTAHILCKRLEELGETTTVVSLDDFYLPHDKLPILPDGKRDTESVDSLDKELMKKCFNEIIATGRTYLPHYDFAKGESNPNSRLVDIRNHGIIIAEGLHALNPVITDLVPRKNIFKAYISVNCSIEDNFGEQLLSSRQIRLARRALRDRVTRGTDINKTLSFWNAVVEGERKYLYCFKNTADAHIKTLHVYEPCIYRDDFLKLKDEIRPDCVCYDYFMRTANALEKFSSMSSELVPKNSLIREFINCASSQI